MAKEWDRKEVKSASPSSLFTGGIDIDLYGKGNDNGKHAHGWGKTENEARENAYKHWDEKYR